jgi:Ser-tRNA(Ala) deacylase AlaX
MANKILVTRSSMPELDEYMEDSTAEADEEYTRALNEQMKENLQYEIYPIVKETNLSLEQLDNLFNRNPEEFIHEYCNLPGFSNGWR